MINKKRECSVCREKKDVNDFQKRSSKTMEIHRQCKSCKVKLFNKNNRLTKDEKNELIRISGKNSFCDMSNFEKVVFGLFLFKNNGKNALSLKTGVSEYRIKKILKTLKENGFIHKKNRKTIFYPQKAVSVTDKEMDIYLNLSVLILENKVVFNKEEDRYYINQKENVNE